jgi:GABA(A) receptor-associated protein
METAVSSALSLVNQQRPLVHTSYVSYKKRVTFEERSEESRRIRNRFPDRIPILVERAIKSIDVPLIDKNKFLAPGDLTVSQFIHIIRRRLQVASEVAIFLFIGNTLPTTGTLLRELYATHMELDGFLYMSYSGENTFG